MAKAGIGHPFMRRILEAHFERRGAWGDSNRKAQGRTALGFLRSLKAHFPLSPLAFFTSSTNSARYPPGSCFRAAAASSSTSP
jgi:hypothetical protein